MWNFRTPWQWVENPSQFSCNFNVYFKRYLKFYNLFLNIQSISLIWQLNYLKKKTQRFERKYEQCMNFTTVFL